MRKKIALALIALIGVGAFAFAEAVDSTQAAENKEVAVDSSKTKNAALLVKNENTKDKAAVQKVKEQNQATEKKEIREVIKEKFIEGGVGFMSVVLICLIFGLAISVERIIMLGLASSSLSSIKKKLDDALGTGDVDSAQQAMKAIPGPVAAIYNQGLSRLDEGLEGVEKAVMTYGAVEMGKLEKGLTWISLFISLAPMLGFMGTVIGMIQAFESIVMSGTIEIDQVAKGIQVALLTTVAGLIVAIILQVFYNYIVSRVDAIVSQMEEGSVLLIDTIIKKDLIKK